MWQDYFLKFSDAQEWLSCVPEAWFVEGDLVFYSKDYAIDVVGIIYHDDTQEITPGYHVNLRICGENGLPEAFSAHVIDRPAFPRRIFA